MSSQIIETFYNAMANADVEGMIRCYHEKIQFHDPVFGSLSGAEVPDMWRMILSRNIRVKVLVTNIRSTDNTGYADWEASYVFSRTAKNVINKISSNFEFEDGKIIKQNDHFDLWKWSRQAFGLSGWLLGWTSIYQRKLQKRSRTLLEGFRNGPALLDA